ncbi:hypothetical protein DPMN_104606 [Dreissena polymorpha]|uniref:Ig-like domain-containing protein n=1 Tax=Dreissena polymorpha TaxID=45954 RepID=A0A9D4HCC0_DREPO|nr:hypothetical protein DPMN_104606 [Dreissena polymorpha]
MGVHRFTPLPALYGDWLETNCSVFTVSSLWGSSTTTAITCNGTKYNTHVGIDWNARQDGTNRPRRLRGNSSAILVGCTSQNGTYTCTSGNTPPGKYVLKHTVTGLHTHILLGIHLQGNACH